MRATDEATPDSLIASIPGRVTLPKLRDVARACRGCDLWERGTQTVFGEGRGQVMLVGEQPGDREDIEGHPFVGPAGKLLDACLDEARIDRAAVYITNAVKHFKWEPRGKRRLHKKPNAGEIHACRPWLDAEIRAIQPEVVVCLGATAAQALLGPTFRVTKDRGRVLSAEIAPRVVATVHPSSLLRAPTAEARHLERARFVADLGVVAALIRTRERRTLGA